MQVISHRGNLIGPNFLENDKFIVSSLIEDEGITVEIDIWTWFDKIYMTHDFDPSEENEISIEWIDKYRKNLLIHAKDHKSVEWLKDTDLHWFYHDKDTFSRTSKGLLICYGKIIDGPNSLIMMPEHFKFEPKDIPKDVGYVCTNYVRAYREKLC